MARPSGCLKCGSKDVKRILYGEPEEHVTPRNDVYAGGCLVSGLGDDPLWHCGKCNWEWGPDTQGFYNRGEE